MDSVLQIVRLRSSHHEATAAVGGALAEVVVPGDVIVLTGPLGVGRHDSCRVSLLVSGSPHA